jgi:hypothetical protein
MTAQGAVYLLVGVLAARSGWGDKERALVFLQGQPLGELLLFAIAVGLLGYVAWRIAQALWDPEGEGWLKRIGSACIAVGYGGLAFFALRRVFGERPAPGGDVRVAREASWELLKRTMSPTLTTAPAAIAPQLMRRPNRGASARRVSTASTAGSSPTRLRPWVVSMRRSHEACPAKGPPQVAQMSGRARGRRAPALG